ncbi:uncharacterized protein [Pyxicephalus adspersus]|uniref:uncharacterized protein isoform X2 n=1 Tax=Pyxicephalus adspersus TaxID=30357 RepID=UPI003B5AF080
MGTLVLYISLSCLIHVILGSPLSCNTKIREIPPDFKRLNGLWNLKAVIGLPELPKSTYSYLHVKVSEKEVHFWAFPLPTLDGTFVAKRIHDDEGSLDYSYGADNVVLSQTQPDSLIIQMRVNNKLNVSSLSSKGTSISPTELEEFKQWGECNGVQDFIELNITTNYAQTCFGMFHVSKQLEEIKDDFTSWHLIAKSSSTADHHYDLRILYKARLEITKKGEEYTLQEIITAPTDTTLLELTFTTNVYSDRNKVMSFKTGEDLLLLGVQTEDGKTLYLASRNPTTKQSVINKFKTQALCFNAKFNYFMPGSIENDDDAESCAHKLEQMVPMNFRESVGKWVLTVSAHEKAETALADVSALYGVTEITITDNKVHVSHTSIHQGILYLLEKSDIEVDESTGHVLYKDTLQGTRSSVFRVSPNCIMFSPELLPGKLYLNCRANQIPSENEITKFVQYANCRRFNSIVLRRHSSSSCSDWPNEVAVLDVDKIAGKWKLTALASNVPKEDVHLPSEIEFIINDGEVAITDGNWKSPALKIEERRLQYAKGEESTMEMRFHDPLDDTLLIWVGNIEEHKFFLVLFSKPGGVKPDDIQKFKHYADCLSIPVTFIEA